MKPLALICDLDGTLCIKGDRPFNDYNRVGEDKINFPVRKVLSKFKEYKIILVSGREDKDYCRSLTELWLKSYFVKYDALFMRKYGDFRSDDVVKREIYFRDIDPNYDVLFVLDDRDRVVRMWRDIGLTCFQVAYGDF